MQCDSVPIISRFLDPNQLEQARHLARFSAATDSHSSDALAEGVTAYLRALRERTYQHMAQDVRWERSTKPIIHQSVSATDFVLSDIINNTPKEYVLSVPAIWSDLAKDRTLRCAFDAGFGVRGDTSSIRLVTEPEAAAVYTITTVSARFCAESWAHRRLMSPRSRTALSRSTMCLWCVTLAVALS
jgi:hypothetical protein